MFGLIVVIVLFFVAAILLFYAWGRPQIPEGEERFDDVVKIPSAFIFKDRMRRYLQKDQLECVDEIVKDCDRFAKEYYMPAVNNSRMYDEYKAKNAAIEEVVPILWASALLFCAEIAIILHKSFDLLIVVSILIAIGSSLAVVTICCFVYRYKLKAGIPNRMKLSVLREEFERKKGSYVDPDIGDHFEFVRFVVDEYDWFMPLVLKKTQRRHFCVHIVPIIATFSLLCL